MGHIRVASPRTTMTGQLALLITATVVATMIITGVQHEWAVFRLVAPSPPELTSGGKFAARVEAMRSADTAIVAPPPNVPLLVADPALRTVPVSLAWDASASAPSPKTAAEVGRPARRTLHGEPHRQSVAAGLVDVMPPKRSEVLVARASPLVEEEAEGGPALWRITKGFYKQAVWLGGAMLDRVNPVNLLP